MTNNYRSQTILVEIQGVLVVKLYVTLLGVV